MVLWVFLFFLGVSSVILHPKTTCGRNNFFGEKRGTWEEETWRKGSQLRACSHRPFLGDESIKKSKHKHKKQELHEYCQNSSQRVEHVVHMSKNQKNMAKEMQCSTNKPHKSLQNNNNTWQTDQKTILHQYTPPFPNKPWQHILDSTIHPQNHFKKTQSLQQNHPKTQSICKTSNRTKFSTPKHTPLKRKKKHKPTMPCVAGS